MPEPLTYTEVGATLDAAVPMPSGYHHVERRVRVGDGDEVFRRVADGVLRWQVLRGAGLDVRAEVERAVEGAEVTSVTRLGPLRVPAPCRVVGVYDRPNRAGFAYGTLRGHPVSGEEAFTVERDADGAVWFTVRAFSRPGTWWSRLGGPVARAVQRRMTTRYLAAARSLAERPPGDPGRSAAAQS
ncbi:DUF1990 domain-containing protein [Streptomyces sp. SID3343]|uniref:DUF1990 family protein n=1 Tax=Streptomyces sp. SID3343 TaxID=2690260 RepID=UPI00136A8972|nr:DUF1990 domain-containing protein [Streptomyces sp. SID3343]MYW00074.1 DUF1990 family protein [Streptomyces sp. SID3343]